MKLHSWEKRQQHIDYPGVQVFRHGAGLFRQDDNKPLIYEGKRRGLYKEIGKQKLPRTIVLLVLSWGIKN